MTGKRFIFLLLFNLLACQSIQAAMNIHTFESPDASHTWEHSATNNVDSPPEAEINAEEHCEHCASCHSHLTLPSSQGLGKYLPDDTLHHVLGRNNSPQKRVELILRPPKVTA